MRISIKRYKLFNKKINFWRWQVQWLKRKQTSRVQQQISPGKKKVSVNLKIGKLKSSAMWNKKKNNKEIWTELKGYMRHYQGHQYMYHGSPRRKRQRERNTKNISRNDVVFVKNYQESEMINYRMEEGI